MIKKIQTKTCLSLPKDFLSLVFSRPIITTSDKNKVVKIQNNIRRLILNDLKRASYEKEDVYKDNRMRFDINYSDAKDQIFNLHTIIQSWGVMKEEYSIIELANLFWKVFGNLKRFININDKTGREHYFSFMHTLSGFSEEKSLMESMVKRVLMLKNQSYGKDALNIAYTLIKMDKLALIIIQKTEAVYSQYSDYDVMQFYQSIPVELNKNFHETYLKNLKKTNLDNINQAIIGFARGPIKINSIHKAITEHHFKLG